MKVKVGGVIYEGAKIDFAQDGETVKAIRLQKLPIEGEQIRTAKQTDPDKTVSGLYVHIGLLSSTKEDPKVKASFDALKGKSNLISNKDLEKFVAGATGNFKPTHIGYLESSQDLSRRLAEAIAKTEGIPSENVILIKKKRYENFRDAIDEEAYAKAKANLRRSVDTYLEKRQKGGPGVIGKKGTAPAVMRLLRSKYDLGIEDFAKDKADVPILEVLDQAFTKNSGVRLLLVDDNIHTGTDMSKIAENLNSLRKTKAKVDGKEVEGSLEGKVEAFVLYHIRKGEAGEASKGKRSPKLIRVNTVVKNTKVVVGSADLGDRVYHILPPGQQKTATVVDNAKPIQSTSGLAIAMLGKKKGEEFEFGSNTYVVKDIYKP